MLQREDLRLAADQSELFTYSIMKNRYMGLNDYMFKVYCKNFDLMNTW